MRPLDGIKVLEFAALGPGPLACMLLADLGADVVSLRRPGASPLEDLQARDATRRGRTEIAVDLRSDEGRRLALRLAGQADACLEGFRPGVMERLGLGPETLLAANRRLVYCRVTGYGQDGPLAQVAGHDINYLSIAGVLGAMRREGERPLFPLNLLGDYGGGGMLAVVGLLSALLEATRTGRGQVVDAAMVDGVAQLATVIFGFAASGEWGAPGTNLLDSGAPFYDVYETSDGRHMAVGAIEPQFYGELLRLLGIDEQDAPQWDRSRWPQLKRRFAEVFATRTREEWTSVFECAEACTTPVLDLTEAPDHVHNSARGTFADREGGRLPASAPRFSGTGAEAPLNGVRPLAHWGFAEDEALELMSQGALA